MLLLLKLCFFLYYFRADSVAWNLHKMSCVPVQCSALLVKEKVCCKLYIHGLLNVKPLEYCKRFQKIITGKWLGLDTYNYYIVTPCDCLF